MLVHMLYCVEKHATMSTTASYKHVQHTDSSTGSLTSDLTYITGIYRQWHTHTHPSPLPNSTHVCTFGYPSISHRPDTIYKKEEQEVGTYTLQKYTLQTLMPRLLHLVAVEKI